MDAACTHIDDRLTPFIDDSFVRVTKEDILKLMEIKMGRNLEIQFGQNGRFHYRYQSETINNHLANIVGTPPTGSRCWKRNTERISPTHGLRNFDTIETAKVVETNEVIY